MKRLQKWTHSFRSDRSGNAAMIVALAVPALIGSSGFAVDVSQWYLWKRELQHSVDQAAYAGAWALAREESKGTYDRRARQEFNANLKVTRNFASAPTIRIADWAGGDDNSVIVTASATKTLPFSSFLTGSGITVSATARARFAEGRNFQACLVATANNGTGTSIGGNAYVDARCGIAALSCDDDAITIDRNATVITNVVVACGEIDAPNNLTGITPGTKNVVVEGVTGLVDPFSHIKPILNNTPQTYTCRGSGKNRIASLQPGTYKSLAVQCTTTLASGIYVIDGGVLDLAGNFNISGMSVQFILRNGATVKLGGVGNSNRINLTPPDVAATDELESMLIIEERTNKTPQPQHILNGNSNSVIEGNIYLPSGTLRVNGTANVTSQCLQITANRIDILGNARLETFCPANRTSAVGGGTPEVRLVA